MENQKNYYKVTLKENTGLTCDKPFIIHQQTYEQLEEIGFLARYAEKVEFMGIDEGFNGPDDMDNDEFQFWA